MLSGSPPWLLQSFALAVAALHIMLALIVTIDVLLKKSDVRAALGWIAAAWLSPIFGSLLYYLFGINRVTRRALKLTRHAVPQASAPGPSAPDAPENLATLLHVSNCVTEAPLTAGNSLCILRNGDEAYPAMLQAIAEARSCIAMASYIFRGDKVGDAFAEALIAAQQRGVEVRVLLDGIGAGYLFSPILRRMRRGGVKAERFLHTWVPWRMPFLNMRNHRKLLVVDGRLAFLGGLNVGAENCASLSPNAYIADTHFRVEGPVVRVVMNAFARDWTFTSEEVLDDDVWWPRLEALGSVFSRGIRSGPDADIYKLETILGAALSLAKERVRIVTPYFLPDSRLQFMLAEAGLRGVKVEVVLPGKSDQTIMDWAMRGHLRFFKHIRANIYYSPPPFDHSKLCTIDGEWSLIGSSNWDARSFRLNFEFDLECVSKTLTEEIDELIDSRIASGKIITPRMLEAEPVWKKLRNAAARLMMPYL